MKINPLHSLTTNPYQNTGKQKETAKETERKQADKLEISVDAKQMLEHSEVRTEREKKVAELKKQYEAGTYKVDYERTAEKMLKFWRK